MPLYEVAILEIPKKDDADNGAEESLCWDGKVIAKNPETAKAKALLENGYTIPQEAKHQGRFQVHCRPFLIG